MNPAIDEYEMMARLIEPDGVTCVMALAIKSPLSVDDLCRIIKRKARYVTDLMDRCFRYGYAGPNAPLDLSTWHITDKARAMIAALFQNLIGHGSNPRQTLLTTPGSNPDHLAIGGSNPASLDLDGVARGAQHALIHSDQISDQSSDFDHDQESEMNETAARDVQAVAAALDRYGIRDLPGKPNRTILLADEWVTPERITAAIERAKVNPRRMSPSPIGLAVAELLRHRPEIDEWMAQHAQAEQAEPIESDPETDLFIEHSRKLHAVYEEFKRISDDPMSDRECIRAAYEAWQAVIKEAG